MKPEVVVLGHLINAVSIHPKSGGNPSHPTDNNTHLCYRVKGIFGNHQILPNIYP